MASEQLPKMGKILFNSFLSASKGIKMGKSDFNLTKTYSNVFIDVANVKDYNTFFNISTALPVSYLYILGMRSQLALMNDKTFPIALMGMVHLGNTLEMLGEIDVKKPLELETSVKVEAKEEGSLFPELHINFIQDGKTVATCDSNYIAKRKRKSAAKKTDTPQETPAPKTAFYSEELVFPKDIGWKYAKISGDYNPIHVINFLAKMFGFKSTIVHGWNSASRVYGIAEKQKGKELKYITVNFKTPVPIPSKATVEYYDETNGDTAFKVTNKKGEMCLEGFVK